MDLTIREYRADDWPSIWPFLRATVQAGDTLVHDPNSTEAQIKQSWVLDPLLAQVACAPDGAILGVYLLRANQPGLGAHVCNAGYVVDPRAQGLGVARAMCEHSQWAALALGFRAMQFNFVVSTNIRAVALWQSLGFERVGTLPGAFRHATLGYVDAYVMFKSLA